MDKEISERMPTPSDPKSNTQRREANTCIALGAGIGALGAAGVMLSGAVCTACVVVAPGLVAIGAFKRWRIAKDSKAATKQRGP
jgi:hypothetical protein